MPRQCTVDYYIRSTVPVAMDHYLGIAAVGQRS